MVTLSIEKPLRELLNHPRWAITEALNANRIGLAMSCGGINPGRVELASPRVKHGDVLWVVSTPRPPVPASLHLLALQIKPSVSGF